MSKTERAINFVERLLSIATKPEDIEWLTEQLFLLKREGELND